jgi:putative cell wall-binding protein
VYLATGANFPDALSAGGAAASKSAPVILVHGNASSVDAATRNALANLRAFTVDVVGGTGTVSAAFASSLASIPGLQVTRLSGSDRYATSQAVDEDAFMSAYLADEPFTPPHFAFLAVGTNFPDALSGGALAGHLGAPLFVIPSNCIPERVMVDIEDLQIETLVLLGGGGSLTLSVSSFAKCPA